MYGKENEWLTRNAGKRIAPTGSAEIWDVNIMDIDYRKINFGKADAKDEGCEYPDLDGFRIDPSNCPEYISCEDYHEQEEFYE